MLFIGWLLIDRLLDVSGMRFVSVCSSVDLLEFDLLISLNILLLCIVKFVLCMVLM